MASRAILKTNLVFGMVSIPIRLVSAYNTAQGVSLHWMHVGDGACGGSVGYTKTCKGCGQALENWQVGSGYKHGDVLIEITDADLDTLPTPSKGKVTLTQFVHADDIPPQMYDTMYYLEPEDVGRGPYDLLARTLLNRDVLGIGTITIRSKESLCAIRPEDNGALVLETLRRPDELKPPPTLTPTPEPAQEMLEVAGLLVDAQTKPFDASLFTDQYQVALNALIADKIAGNPIVPAPVPAPSPSNDVMAQLRASLQQAQALPETAPVRIARKRKAS